MSYAKSEVRPSAPEPTTPEPATAGSAMAPKPAMPEPATPKSSAAPPAANNPTVAHAAATQSALSGSARPESVATEQFATEPGAPVQMRLHHLATVIRDQHRNREFFEDVLGFPLVATWCEKSFMKDLDEWHEYCHTFYELDDGSALAFFQFATPGMYERCQPRQRAEISRFGHVAIRISAERQEQMLERLQRHQAPHRVVDHGYCKSLYTTSPDGLDVEFTVDAADSPQQWAERRRHAHEELARWMSGDHSTNNDHR